MCPHEHQNGQTNDGTQIWFNLFVTTYELAKSLLFFFQKQKNNHMHVTLRHVDNSAQKQKKCPSAFIDSCFCCSEYTCFALNIIAILSSVFSAMVSNVSPSHSSSSAFIHPSGSFSLAHFNVQTYQISTHTHKRKMLVYHNNNKQTRHCIRCTSHSLPLSLSQNVRSKLQPATNKNYNNNFFNSLSKACHTLIGLLTNLNGVPGPWHNGK